ncbi:MAG: DUF411 domain-containing protein [Alcaligenaceae bacterium]|nr:DUF411 domain-containing protein [Alcaligenaceae bacterium]
MNPRKPLRNCILFLSEKLPATALGIALLQPIVTPAQTLPPVTVWQAPNCGCCKNWAADMQKYGFQLEIYSVPDTTPYRRQLGIPDEMASCQTATVGIYALEGNVAAIDVISMLQAQPDILGLVTPGTVRLGKNTDSRPQHTYILSKYGQAMPLHPGQ